MTRSNFRPASTRALTRRGSILILTLAVLIVLTALALTLARSMRAQAQAAATQEGQARARAAALGAIEYLKTTLLTYSPTEVDQVEAVPVGGAYYWLLYRDPENPGYYSFGVTDETDTSITTGKINLNSANATQLTSVPNVTLDMANAIIAWRSDSSDSQAYLSQTPPYQAKGERFETVGELLLVQGFTPDILFGNDRNRNGVLDDGDADPLDPTAISGATLDEGVLDYFTVYSPITVGPARLTVRGASADIVAVDAAGRSFVRWRVVFDTTNNPVRVLYVRDLTSLGWPLDPQILTDLRAGRAPSDAG